MTSAVVTRGEEKGTKEFNNQLEGEGERVQEALLHLHTIIRADPLLLKQNRASGGKN